MSRILQGLLVSIILCALAAADAFKPAPPFSVQTLDGETFTSTSLRGRVTLLQFWATWCPYCRRDQSAVDDMERMFADQGLVVLAVDVNEKESTVRNYLQANPRSCRVVLNGGTELAARFGAHGFPYYVLIDGNGNIAGVQSGAGGEGSLRHLLGRAGLSQGPDARAAGSRKSTVPTAIIAKSTVIEVAGAQSAPPSKPRPKTIFFFTDGTRLEADHYLLDATCLHVEVDGQQRTIALSALDKKTTLTINHQRGVDLNIPQSLSEIFLAF